MARQPAGHRQQQRRYLPRYFAMVLHGLITLERDNPRGSTIAQVEQQIRLLYNSPDIQARLNFDDLPDSHALQVEMQLKKMVRRRQAFKTKPDKYMFLYTSKLHYKFRDAGGGGGYRPRGPGILPHMINYNMMIMHAIYSLEPENPEGSTTAQVEHRIGLLYESLPYSHSAQVENWLKIMIRSGQAYEASLDRYKIMHGCELHETFVGYGVGRRNVMPLAN